MLDEEEPPTYLQCTVRTFSSMDISVWIPAEPDEDEFEPVYPLE